MQATLTDLLRVNSGSHYFGKDFKLTETQTESKTKPEVLTHIFNSIKSQQRPFDEIDPRKFTLLKNQIVKFSDGAHSDTTTAIISHIDKLLCPFVLTELYTLMAKPAAQAENKDIEFLLCFLTSMHFNQITLFHLREITREADQFQQLKAKYPHIRIAMKNNHPPNFYLDMGNLAEAPAETAATILNLLGHLKTKEMEQLEKDEEYLHYLITHQSHNDPLIAYVSANILGQLLLNECTYTLRQAFEIMNKNLEEAKKKARLYPDIYPFQRFYTFKNCRNRLIFLRKNYRSIRASRFDRRAI